MKPVHANLAKKRFQRTNNIVSAKICLDSGCSATESCTRTTTEVFVRGTVPKACEGHQTLKICKETGKIANEYCTDVEEQTFLVKPPKEETNLWKTDEGDKYNIPTETCDKHKAPEEVEMINIVGKKITDAKKLLEDLGLKVEVKFEENKDKDDGIVLTQSVKEKEKVEVGKTITLTVSKKVEVITNTEVPDKNNTIDGNTTGGNTTSGGNTTGGNTASGENTGSNGKTNSGENTTSGDKTNTQNKP